jgi:hypothetical protein
MGFLPVLLKVISFLPALVTGAENIFGAKNGDEKRNNIISFIIPVLAMAEGIKGKDIVDNNAFQDGLKQAIDGIVKMLNASVWNKNRVPT